MGDAGPVFETETQSTRGLMEKRRTLATWDGFPALMPISWFWIRSTGRPVRNDALFSLVRSGNKLSRERTREGWEICG